MQIWINIFLANNNLYFYLFGLGKFKASINLISFNCIMRETTAWISSALISTKLIISQQQKKAN